MHPLESYLHTLSEIHLSGAGVKETSYYPALATLLNDVGKSLKPKVRCIIHLRSQGAGIPDGGLFTVDQLRGLDEDADPLAGQLPARAVLEAKGISADLDALCASEQVAKYLGKYGLVLVTNYRAFQLLRAGPQGKPLKLEAYTLAETEKDFWVLAAHPRKAVQTHGELFTDYLRRVMLADAPLTTPEDVAWFLASYARDARARLELPSPAGRGAGGEGLAAIRQALEETLGLTFEGDKGEHFFRSTLVQTLFYGIFSAWVLWHGENPARQDTFDWRTSAYYLHVRVIQALFEQVADPSKLRALRLMDVLERAGATLNRVDREAFFAAFEQGQAVQYFYEPFLQAFDPQLRKDMGVWYTPPEIVRYMVARVDTVLREELNIADGLADPRVVVLDPCAGTGAYLVEVLNRIAVTLRENGAGALLGGEVKRAARERILGFELLPAPYVVAHLQLGLLLQTLGAPLAEGERVGMYLTNALTGWEPPQEPKTQLPLFYELAQERDAAEKVKREAQILVIIGNPPYNAFAGVSPKEEQGLVEPYKAGLIAEWGIKKFNLDDLYVRFFRLAERRIAEQTGRGVVCFISNHSWVSEPSFVVMRQHLLGSFDRFWIENMHGNRKISEYAPDGRTSETIFAIPGFSAGIQQGVAISLWVKSGRRVKDRQVLFRDDLTAARAVERRADLLASLTDPDFDTHYEAATPEKSNRYSFRPSEATSEYLSWPKLTELCAEAPSNGLMEKRGSALIDIDRDALEQRMRLYYDVSVSWESVKALKTGLTQDAARFDAQKARAKVLAAEKFELYRLMRYALRPFDTRWCFYSPTRPLWNEPRPTLWAQMWEGNSFLMTRPAGVASPEGVPFYFTRLLGDNDFLRGHAYYLPLRLRSEMTGQTSFFTKTDGITANLSPAARAYLTALGLPDPDLTGLGQTGGLHDLSGLEPYELIWMHALAIGYSPAYLRENADGIRQDWPRIPLPDNKDALIASAALGKRVAALLDTETPVPGVTAGAIRPELRQIAVVEGATPLNLAVTAGWGSAGKGGVTMPGKGKRVERAPTPQEHVTGLGDTTHDVYLNDDTYWRNVPARVWDYTIGGYQVIKKWLSYREQKLLGRPLTHDEAREVQHIARRIAAIVLLEPELNANYAAVKASAASSRRPG
ncbi:MAG: type ISP restriction/modification enzyme [Anaerolineae bacterium]